MDGALEPARTGTSGVAFELDRFEMAAGDRLEVNGRWFGVRGRRFMRPSLTLVADEDQRRLLADLEHKPWAAQDGEPWEAVFPYDADEGGWIEAELNVAPDITVTLPLPGAGPAATAAGRRRHDGRVGARAEAATARKPTRKRIAETSPDLTRARRELERVRSELERAGSELERKGAEAVELSAELERQGVELERRGAELERRGAELERMSAAQVAARKAGGLAIEEREQLARARDEALAARDQAVAARGEALAERRDAVRARDEMAAKLEEALAAHSRAAADLDAALAASDQATAERNALVAARDGAIASHRRACAERDALSSTLEQLRVERDDAVSSRGAALVMRNAANAPPSYRREGSRILHFLPAFVVLVAAIVVAFVLHII